MFKEFRGVCWTRLRIDRCIECLPGKRGHGRELRISTTDRRYDLTSDFPGWQLGTILVQLFEKVIITLKGKTGQSDRADDVQSHSLGA